MDLKENKNKPPIKRRKFLFLFGASAVGLMAMTRSPLKLISSIFNKSQGKSALSDSRTGKNGKITVRENPYAVKREAQGTQRKGSVNG